MKPESRHRVIAAALLLGCLLVATGQSQFVEDSIQVPGAWVGSLVYNSREDVIYGQSTSQGAVFAISCDSNRVVASHQLTGALALAYDSTDNKAWCTYYGPEQESLAVIDGETHVIVKRMEMPGATIPVWDPVSNRVYVSCQSSGQVAVVDCRTDSILKYIAVGWCPIKMYLNTLRRKLYVLNNDAGTVSVIDLLGDSVVKTVEVRGAQNAGYYCQSVDRFYCGGDDSIVRIPVARHSNVYAMSGSDRRSVVLASVFGGGSRLYAIDVETNAVDTVIQAGEVTDAICWSPQSDRFYCTSAFTDEVLVLSGDGRKHLMTLPVGDAPFVFCAVPRHRRIYVGHLNCSKVYVIRDTDIPWPEGQPSVPETTAGLHLSPSPFRGRLTIVSGTEVTAGILRVLGGDGRLVRVLNVTKPASGVLRSSWDGKDSHGRAVPAGVYFVEAAGIARAKVVKLK
jgi:YVTN family beta-propeller protein